MNIYNSILDCVGKTPLIRLQNIERKFHTNNKILVKLEKLNPTGSIKIRIAKEMILKALERNTINKDTPIIEATSGNTGVGLACVCAALGFKFIAVMPENMSLERQKLIKAYGGEILLTDSSLGMNGAVSKALEIKKEMNGFIPSQFDNPDNPSSHIYTANEIWTDTDGEVDIVACSIGTGGTISGIGKTLKNKKNVTIVGIEPSASPLLSKGYYGSHKIQGIGANFIPKTLDLTVVDKIQTVSDEDAYNYALLLSKEEGIFVGPSSGAALKGAIEYINENKIQNKTIVVILPDTGERYLSTEMI